MTNEELLAAHEKMTKAWYDNWLKEQRRRMNEVFARRQEEAPQGAQDWRMKMRGTLIVYAHPETLGLLADRQKRFYGHRVRIFDRIHAAWLVFTGRADALMWDGEVAYGYDERLEQ